MLSDLGNVLIIVWKWNKLLGGLFFFCLYIVCLQLEPHFHTGEEMLVSVKLSVKHTNLPATFSSFQIFLRQEITEFSQNVVRELGEERKKYEKKRRVRVRSDWI